MSTVENSTPTSYEDLKNTEPYKKDLQDLTREIQELTDNDNTNDAIETVIVDGQLNNALKDYLMKDKKVTDLIKGELDRIIKDSTISGKAKESATSLKKLIESINTTGEPTNPESPAQPEGPKLDLKGNLGEPKPGEDKTLFKGMVRDRPAPGEEPDVKFRFYAMVERIRGGGENKGLKDKVSDLESKGNLSENIKQGLGNIKTLLNNVDKIIDNTSPDNVKNLQQFISENLDDNKEFNSLSKGKDGFDGKFGEGTLKGLNLVLDKVEEYLNTVSTTLDKTKSQETTPENLNEVEPVAEVIKVGKDSEINPEKWLKGLPKEAEVSIKSGTVNKEKSDPQDLILVVTLGGKTIDVPVKVQVVENLDGDPDKSTQQAQNIEPYEHNGQKYEASSRSQEFAQRCGLDGAAFFDIEGVNDEYLLKLGEDVYRVKFDDHGLCPTAKTLDGKPILFKNNPACISYLQGKAPEGAIIGWHNGLEDYTITLENGSKLTIEPMTIDGKWVSENLRECLALLNFTNYLRSFSFIEPEQQIRFKNNNPDLKLDGKVLKVRVDKESNGGEKWYDVPMERFGLTNIDDKVLKKFIKYNNGEHWEDNWDKKDDNKGYQKKPLTVSEFVAVHPTSRVIPEQQNLGAATEERTGNASLEAGEHSKLSNDVINKLGLKVLEDSASVVQGFNIPTNTTIYFSENKPNVFYYKDGDNLFCIGEEQEQEWRKWEVAGENYQTRYEHINVCSRGLNRLNSILGDSLNELKDSKLMDDNEFKDISIKIDNNQYTLVNGKKKLPIDDSFLHEPNIKNGLKMVCLASKLVPGEFYWDDKDDGGIVKKEYQEDGNEYKVVIPKDKFEEIGLNNGNMKTYAEYLNKISEGLANSENPGEGGESSNVATVDGAVAEGAINTGGGDTPAVGSPERMKLNDPENVTQYGLRWNELSNKLAEKEKLGIPTRIVYTDPKNPGKVFYKASDCVYGIPGNEPFIKEKYELQNPLQIVNFELNVCQAGVDKFKTYLKDDPQATVSIEDGKYKLKFGNSSKSIILDDDLLRPEASNNFFGVDTPENKLKVLSLALQANAKRNKAEYSDPYINTSSGDLVCFKLPTPQGQGSYVPAGVETVIIGSSVMDEYNIKNKTEFAKYIKELG